MAIRKVVPGSLTEAYKLRQADFAPNLVGNQFTSPNAFFTLGNFEITSNFNGRVSKDFTLGEFSDYYNLENLNISEQQLEEQISNNIFVNLNFDKTNVFKYVYFGSFSKQLESEIQEIILKWPAALSITVEPIVGTSSRPNNVNTVLDFNYNPTLKLSSFKSPLGGINNSYQIDFTNNTVNQNSIVNQTTDYVLANENGDEFVIRGMTGSTNNNNYIYFTIEGNPFTFLSGSTFGKTDFNIKPIKSIRDNFFTNLNDIQKLILNRLTTPKYTFIADVPIKYDNGNIGFSKQSFTWPTSDGYNLDIDTVNYSRYIENLFKIASLYDDSKTDLMYRRLVSDSIVEYDTEGDGTINDGMRVSKLLRIYGAEFDVVKKYINGISFANVVTYDKNDNTSDSLIKIMAKTLGFDTLLTTNQGFGLLTNEDEGDDPQFQGYSRELSPNQIDVELWRRLVINAWWLFRSKGTRKVLEFFMNLFRINNCLVSMDERIYIVKNKLNLTKLRKQFSDLFGPDYFNINRKSFPVDDYGFPRILRNTEDYYFQNDRFWYNGGNESTTGNNPHYGPYDYGQKYFDKFRCFVEDFQQSVNMVKTEENVTNYFTEYNDGTFTPDSNGQAFPNYGLEVPPFFVNPNDNIDVLSAGIVVFGEENGPLNVRDSGDTYSLRVTFQAGESELCSDCPPETAFGLDGLIYITDPNTDSVPHNIEECCDFYWLPSTNESNGSNGTGNTNEGNKCPNEFTISLQGPYQVVLSGFGNSLSQQCCYEYLTTLSPNNNGVSWNSTIGCYLGTDEPVTPGGGTVGSGNGTTPIEDTGDVIIITPPNENQDPIGCQILSDEVPFGLGGTVNLENGCITFSNVPQSDWNGGNVPSSLVFTIEAPDASPSNTVELNITTKGPISNIAGTVAAGTVQQDGINYNLRLTSSTNTSIPTPNIYYSQFLNPYQTETFSITLDQPGTYTFNMDVYPYNSSDNFFQVCTNCNQTPTVGNTQKKGGIQIVPGQSKPNAGGLLPLPPKPTEDGYYCWWCPPEESLSIVCNSEDYLNNLNLTDNQTIALAKQYGGESLNFNQATDFLINLFDTFFTENKCIYMINGTVLKNKECCELRGGIWNEELQLCELPQEVENCSPANITTILDGIVGNPVDLSQPAESNNFSMLDDNCCNSLGYYFGNKNVSIFKLDTTIQNIPISPLGNAFLVNEPNSLNGRFGCFDCPRTIKESSGTTNDGTIIYFTDINDNELSQNCCDRYGGNYEFYQNGITINSGSKQTTFGSLCRSCKNMSPTGNNVVLNTDQTIPTKDCCEINGYFYQETNDPINNISVGCYQCPPVNGDNYVTETVIIDGIQYLTYTDSNGNSLSNDCCMYYKQEVNNEKIQWNQQIGCHQN